VNLIRKFGKEVVENFLSSTFGRYIWAPVSVSVLAHGENHDILVLESKDGVELPGGLVKGGEGLRETGRREVKEETGCEVELGNLLEISTSKGRHPGVHFFFEAEVLKADLEGNWEGDPKFVSKSKVTDLDWRLHHSHAHEYLFPEDG